MTTLFDQIKDEPGFKKQSARTWTGPCPKCGGEDRFIVWIHKDMFKCRNCDFRGDLIKYLREVKDHSCREAFLAAGKECGRTECPAYEKCKGNAAPRRSKARSITPPTGKKKDDWQPRQAETPAELWRRKGTEFVEWAHEQLLATPAQLDWLARRGLPLEAVKKNRLGYNPGAVSHGKPGPLFKNREAWGLEKKRDEEDKRWITVFPIQRGIIIPSFVEGELYRIRIRRLDEDLAQYPKGQRPPKYLFLEGSGKGLVIRNPEAKAFIVVESDLCDQLIDHLAGDIICSVPLTSCNIRPDSDSAEVLKNAVCILNALDFEPRENEKTGQHENPGGQNARWWQKHFPASERWPVPEGKDPTEAHQAGWSLRQWIIEGLPVSLQPRQSEASLALLPSPGSLEEQKNQEAPKVNFDSEKYLRDIMEARGRVASACPTGALEWLAENKTDVCRHLKAADRAVDAAFEARDGAALAKNLKAWEEYHLRAWEIYNERPEVIER